MLIGVICSRSPRRSNNFPHVRKFSPKKEILERVNAHFFLLQSRNFSFGELINHIIFSSALFSLDQSLHLHLFKGLLDVEVLKLDLGHGK